MSNGILRHMDGALQARREAKKEIIIASQRLARRIVDSGRAGDAIHVGMVRYEIEEVAWDCEDESGCYESRSIKTLSAQIGMFCWEDQEANKFSDTRRRVSLLPLSPDGILNIIPKAQPHVAKLAELEEQERLGCYGLQGLGPLFFEPATADDYIYFAEHSRAIIKDFIRVVQQDTAEYNEINSIVTEVLQEL